MGTAKRARQKANRQARLSAVQVAQRKRHTKRRALRIGIIIVLGVAVAFVLSRVWGESDSDNNASDTTTAAAATDPATATTTAATASDVPTYGTTPCPAADGSSPRQTTFSSPFENCLAEGKTYTAVFATSKGGFTVELDATAAPATVNNFVALARHHYYDSLTCHRVIPGFVVQCGDPSGDGSGGPGYEFADELPAAGAYELGSLAMANSGPNTNGSQFFVITGDQGVSLAPDYSLFGKVTEGFDTSVKALEAAGSESGTPSETLTIESVTIQES